MQPTRLFAITLLATTLAACAPTMTPTSNVVTNPTAFGPTVTLSEDGITASLRRVTHSALLNLKLPGEPHAVTNSQHLEKEFYELFKDSSLYCVQQEHLVWTKGQATAYTPQVNTALTAAGYQITEGSKGPDRVTSVAVKDSKYYLLIWDHLEDISSFSVCRAERRSY